MIFSFSDNVPLRTGLWASTLLFLLFFACEERRRLNPIDPLNPFTRGKPTGLKIVSDQGTIDLSWQAFSNEGLQGYAVYRRTDGDTFEKLATVNADSSSYRDARRPFDVTHEYCVSYLAQDYESPPSESVSIIPGPTYTWIADTYAGVLYRLTHDCHHVLMSSVYISYPWLIEVNPHRHSAWVVDAIFGDVSEISADGTILAYYNEFREVSAITFDARRNALWLSDSYESIVYKLDSAGAVLFSRSGFIEPRSLAVDRVSGNCYVADEGTGKISCMAATDGTVSELDITCDTPQSVGVDPVQRLIWVADKSRIIRYCLADSSQLVIGDFHDARAVAVNEQSGECWVLDSGAQYDDGRVALLTKDGDVQFSRQGLLGPRSLSVNTYSGECIVAETGAGRLIRIHADGQIEVLPIDVVYPYDVEVQNR